LHISNVYVVAEINREIKAQVQKLKKLECNNVIQCAQCKIHDKCYKIKSHMCFQICVQKHCVKTRYTSSVMGI